MNVTTALKNEIEGMQESESILEMRSVSKVFPGVKALDGVNLEIKEGEVHALMGENGAGKSTLMKILAAKYKADQGEIIYQGEKLQISNPLEAKEKGIILIHQEISLVPEMTVAENIFLGSLPVKRFNRVDWATLNKRSREILQQLDCDFKETDITGKLTIARQQMVEITRALVHNPKIVIFDEPTASLTDREKDILFTNINKLKKKGVAIVYISHRMDEIFEISDRISVLRDGKKTATLKTSSTNESEITELMIGRKIENKFTIKKNSFGEEVIKLEDLSSKGSFENISFSIRKGEIVGLYGLVGAGRSEVAEALFGIRRPDNGKIYIEGAEKKIANSEKAVEFGIGYVPEDRKHQGLVLGMSCIDNMSLAKLDSLQSFGFVKRNEEMNIFDKYKDVLSISTPGPLQKVVNLSGGNQQKIVIAKWLCMHPKVLILDEPTRGIDVGSKTEIHKLIHKLADDGYAILVISSEMPEIMRVSHRIITMYEGKMTGEFSQDEITETNLINGITNQIQ